MIFEYFFKPRGPYEENSQGEIPVICPFPHDKGYETRPSAHVNPKKGLFHCKTCQAEGRFNEGGLSETNFLAKAYNLTYDQALYLEGMLNNHELYDDDEWERLQRLLYENKPAVEYLNDRGIMNKTIGKYSLGFTGDGIGYPVKMFWHLVDVRTYDPGGKPKMRSKPGAKPWLYPFDEWIVDPQPTLFVAGENDCLLARQMGYNAVTVTGGEGTFPKMLAGLFKGRTVYMCFDCDSAGRKAVRSVAFRLREAGATVYIVDLELPGTKDDKDITDFVVKHGWGTEELNARIKAAALYTGELYLEDKNQHYPLIELWEVPQGKHSGQHRSSRVVLSGTYDQAMQVPSAIEWRCNGAKLDDEGKSPCYGCPLAKDNVDPKSRWWTLDEDNMKTVLRFTEVNEKQQINAINMTLNRPDKCPNGTVHIRALQDVQKVILTPDVETESLEDFRATEQYAYVIGTDMIEGSRYRAFFRVFPHPNNGQRVFLVVDHVEDSDIGINMFKMTESIQEELKKFTGDPFEMMPHRAEMAKDIIGPFARDTIVNGCDLMFHSPLKFIYNGKMIKGYPEGLVVGDTRTGKSDVAQSLVRYYQLGNFTSVKRATTAGLLGGVEKLPTGGHKITWGVIPRNNKSVVFLDEMSDCGLDVIASLTDMRSSGVATVSKVAKGKAPANTRMMWLSNPRKNGDGHNASVIDYPSGVSIVNDLVGATEDIARFDFILLVAEGEYISPLTEITTKAYDSIDYRNLIYWVWSRTPEQVVWEEGVESYVWHVSQELNEKYNTDVKFFGAEAWKKLARIAVACAGCCFSSSADGQLLVVSKRHVDWAARFLTDCYDNNFFRLADYVRDRKAYNETNDAVNTIVEGMCRTKPTVIRALLNSTAPFPRFNLQAISGLENNEFNKLMGELSSNYLVTVSAQGFLPTRRLRKAVEVYRSNADADRMIPLSQQGGPPF